MQKIKKSQITFVFDEISQKYHKNSFLFVISIVDSSSVWPRPLNLVKLSLKWPDLAEISILALF